MIKTLQQIKEKRDAFLTEIETNAGDLYVSTIVLAAKLIKELEVWNIEQMLYKKNEFGEFSMLAGAGDNKHQALHSIALQFYKSVTLQTRNLVVKEVLSLLENPQVCPDLNLDKHFLFFKNGYFNLLKKQFTHVDSTVINSIPLVRFDFEYSEDIESIPPQFLKLFNWWTRGEDSNKTFLMEMIGGLISGLQLEYIFNFYGVESSGKSLLINLLESIIGEEFCIVTKIKSLSERFGTMQILRKKLIVDSDAATTDEIDPEMIKKITGKDAISFEIKGGGFLNKKINTNILITSNEILKFRGTFQGMNRRLIVYNFPFSTINFEKGDRNFEPIMLQELNRIREFRNGHWYFKTRELNAFIAECIKAFSDVVNNNNIFTVSKEMENSKNEVEINSNPILYYLINDFEITDPANFTYNEEHNAYYQKGEVLFEKYKTWCIKSNYKPFGKNNFLQKFAEAIHQKFGFRVEVNKVFLSQRYFVLFGKKIKKVLQFNNFDV